MRLLSSVSDVVGDLGMLAIVPTDQLLLIGGEAQRASDGGRFEVEDPSSGALLANMAKATASDIDRAVRAARAALASKN
jgi:acyl-CoA reductase-like NAD-dependent aldehyde dehydrogenase